MPFGPSFERRTHLIELRTMNRHRLFSIAILALAACFSLSVEAAPPKKTFAVQGEVVSASSGSPVDFASVLVTPSQLYTMTDTKGAFSLKDVPAGTVTVSVQFYGMEQKDTTFTAKTGEIVKLKIALKETSFRLSDVVVVATGNKAGSSTASNISRQAMDHMQTSSLADAMALLPGVAITNPDLSSSQSITIRTARPIVPGETANSASVMNSLGTAVIVDGAPMSNNANLQTLSPVVSGSSGDDSRSGTPARGMDVRSLSTDNIESIEVIRGIPSAEYGDLTSGAVLVKSKAGKSPLMIRFKTNPNIYQASAGKGFSLGKKAGDLNISGDYAYSKNSLTKNHAFYQRASAKALWTVRIGELVNETTSLSMSFGRDRSRLNPDDKDSKTQSYANDMGVAFNTNGRASINGNWLRSINWLVSGSLNDKKSHYESTATNALNLYSKSMTDGEVYSNIAGAQIKDADGNLITNVPADSPVKGVVLPYSYFYMYDIYGKEVNTFVKVNADFAHTWGAVNERLLIGADFKTDGNLGKGSVYDDDTPPYRNIGNAESGYRTRPYYDIPFINQLGLYAENYFNWKFAGRELNIVTGVRYDNVNGHNSVAPRINASIDIFPWMTLRGGYGLTSKAPTSYYLYPNKSYHDHILYNGMVAGMPENEQLLIAQTNVYDATNKDLEIAVNRKAEVGLDFKFGGHYRISVTAYDERMDNGYNYGLDLSSFKWYHALTYDVDHKDAGQRPVLKKGAEYDLFYTVYKPLNNIKSTNRGIEYEIDLGRFNAIRTSFYINGAWMRSSNTNKGYSFGTRDNVGTAEKNIGIYEPELSTSYAEQLNTTLRITHNIPQVGLAVTLTGQMNWYSKYWTEYRNDTMFIKYISRKDGKVYDFDPSMKSDPEFSYMFTPRNDNRFIAEKYFPTMLFNLNVSKEIGDIFTASFYVNNLFNSRPLYKSKQTGERSELGIPIFFGFEFKVSIK